ncbi:hypothetical protein RI129_001117 [Pyrocoelia pectoralis]|uniref:C2H2-type domain-containing protein n=1 Tax=Pyrocoelia pectoralis TaxID=417401 RepID=A0AAN7VUM3_9COLE
MKAIADAYYAGCTDDILTCKSCSRCFSTGYWLKVHEDEHTKEKGPEKQFNCTKCSANFIDSTSLQEHIKGHLTEKEAVASSESIKAAPTISVQSADKDTPIDNISKIAVPLLGNSQISLTPIPKDKKIIKANIDQSVTKVKEDTDISFNERQGLPANTQTELDKSDDDKTKLLDSTKQDDISGEDMFTMGSTKEDIGIASAKEKQITSDAIEKDQELAVLDNDESFSHSSSPLPSPPYFVHSPSAEEQEEHEVVEEEDTKVKKSFVSEEVPTSIVQYSKVEDKKLETSIASKTKKQKNKIKLLKLRFKSLFNKKVHLLKYSRCFICFKIFKTKFSLNQHCKFVHIPNTSDSNYWLNNIKAQKSKCTTADAEPEIKDINDSQDQVDTQETYYTPVRTAKSNKTTSHVCNICGKRVAEERFLELHMFVHTPTFVSMDPNVPQGKNGDVFRCYLCEKVFPKERYLKLHNLQVHLTKTIICKICNREFRSDFWYSQHKCVIPTEVPDVEEPVEDENNQFPCTVCNRKFARLRFMKSHRHRMHKDVNEDGTPKIITKQESALIVKDSDVYDDSDDNDGSNYESDNEYDPHEMKESNRSEVHTGDRMSINELGSRRSLSRGVPKIQCDFCGDYIEETAYDKHIFEHNKLRLDKSLSKRKSLDSSISDTSEKKQILLKCPVCSKPFKRKYNLNVHISKHHEGVEGFDLAADVSELNEPAEEEEKYLSDSESSQKEPPEIVYGQISLIDGIELYECCERTFRLKAHFFRHFKIKHPNCIFKPIYVEQKPVIDSKNVHDEHLVIVKQEINDKDLHKVTDKPVNLGEVEENFEAVEHSFNIEEAKILSKDDTEQKEVRKRGRRRKINPLAEQIVEHEGKDIASSNIDKRNLTTEFVSVNEERPSKRQKLIKRLCDDKSIKTTTSDDSEDMEATAHHLRQLDLLPVVNKNALGRYECHICEKRFKQKCQLRDHFNVHTGDKPYKCDFCNPVRGFTQTSSLYVHFRRVHAVVMKNCVWEVYSKNGSCLICSDVFDKHSHMFKHVKDHYMKKEFECQECHKKFNMSCHYKVHDIDPEEMRNLLSEENLEMDEEDESDIEQETTLESMLIPNVDDDKIDSDTDSSNAADKLSGCDDSKPSKCTKCKKTFPNKQQLRFHKKSLAHIQKIQAIRSKVSEMSSDEMEEDSMKTDSEAIADIENGVKAIIKKIRTFKKHHCNICGASFIKRIHLKKHKRRHKMRRAYLKSREETNTTDMDESQNDTQDAFSNINTADSNNRSHKTESENILEATPSSLSEALSQLNPPIEIQLADKVPADTEIISITTSTSLEKTDELNSNPPRQFVDISELSEKKLDGGSSTDEYGSFDVILKIAESTSDLNKQFLFKHTNANRGINFDIPKSSSNSNLNLKEDLSSQNTIIELPESTITYINPSHSDISLITTGHAIKDEKVNKSDVPELDFTIEVSKCTEIPSSVDNSRNELKKSYNLHVEDIMLEMNNEPCENSLGKVDDKNFIQI